MSALPEAPVREQGSLELLSSMARTRLELATLDLEAHVAATVGAMASGFAALVLALVAFAFVGIALIAIFWDTHRVIATVSTTLGYCVVALGVAAHARALWRSRPPALEGTLHELALDREALRGL
jgi:uncharacterized membrane protein YqjE